MGFVGVWGEELGFWRFCGRVTETWLVLFLDLDAVRMPWSGGGGKLYGDTSRRRFMVTGDITRFLPFTFLPETTTPEISLLANQVSELRSYPQPLKGNKAYPQSGGKRDVPRRITCLGTWSGR